MSNKVKFGLKNVHIFPFKEEQSPSNIGFDSPFSLPGAVSLSIDPQGESEPFYADDTTFYVSEVNGGYEGELTVAQLNEEFETKILGVLKDENGALVEVDSAKNTSFAMAFEFTGDKKKTRHILYNCTASRPKLESGTKEDKVTPQTDTFSFKAIPLLDTGIIKAKIEEGKEGYDSFFTTPYEPGRFGA